VRWRWRWFWGEWNGGGDGFLDEWDGNAESRFVRVEITEVESGEGDFESGRGKPEIGNKTKKPSEVAGGEERLEVSAGPLC
jgi:hypothetical protein